MLGESLKGDDLVFSNIEGEPLLPNTVTHAWIKLVRQTVSISSSTLHSATMSIRSSSMTGAPKTKGYAWPLQMKELTVLS